MKITDVKALTLSCPLAKKLGGAFRNKSGSWRRETLLIKVETDEGLVGWGESFAFPPVGLMLQGNNQCSGTETARSTQGGERYEHHWC